MNDTIEKELRELAVQNDIDPDEFLALAASMALPGDIQEAVDAILADVATFGLALDKLKE